MKKLIQIKVIIILFILTYNSYGQSSNSKIEFSCFGKNIFHLADHDLAFNPDYGYTKSNWELVRIAYHGNPKRTLGLYSRFTWGGGYVARGIALNMMTMKDLMNHETLFLGTTVNPMHSSKIWFQLAAGFDRLFINGADDFVVSGGNGTIHFTGNSMALLLNNMQYSSTLVRGYPEFKRVAFALNAGVSLRVYRAFSTHFDYTPILVSPVRNDFSFGFTFIFPGK